MGEKGAKARTKYRSEGLCTLLRRRVSVPANSRRPRYLLCGNLVGDIKDHDEPISDLRTDIADLRIDLIADLLLACRSACYLAN